MMEENKLEHFSLRNILYIVFRYKYQIVTFLCVTVLATLFFTFRMDPVYSASSQILLKSIRDDFYVATSGKAIMAPNREEEINSEIELLRGRALAEQMMTIMGPLAVYPELTYKGKAVRDWAGASPEIRTAIMEMAIEEFTKHLTVEWVKKSNIINLAFEHTDPKIVADALNTFVQLYFDRHLQVHKNPQSLIFFEEQAKLLKNQVEKAEKQLRAYKEKQGVTSVDQEQDILLRQEGDLNFALSNANREVVELDNRLKQVREQLGKTPMNIRQGGEVQQATELIGPLEARLMELELKEKEMLLKYKADSRSVTSVENEIRIVREKLAELQGKRYEKSTFGINTTHQNLQQELFRLEADFKAAQSKKQMLTEQLASYQQRLNRLNELKTEINRLEQNMTMDQENYRLYQTKYEEARISDAMNTQKITNVSLIEPARQPLKPIKPRKALNLLFGMILGLIGGVGIAFFRNYLDDSLKAPEDIEKSLGLPFLGSVGVIRTDAVS